MKRNSILAAAALALGVSACGSEREAEVAGTAPSCTWASLGECAGPSTQQACLGSDPSWSSSGCPASLAGISGSTIVGRCTESFPSTNALPAASLVYVLYGPTRTTAEAEAFCTGLPTIPGAPSGATTSFEAD